MIRGGTAPDCCGKATHRKGNEKLRIGDALVSMGKALRGEAMAKTSMEWRRQSKVWRN
jgi:hypothetical protein